MQKLTWNEYLSSSHPWTKRLLGLEPFSKQRNLEQIEREYNRETYGKLLEFDFTDVELYKSQQQELTGCGLEDNIAVSFGDELFETHVSLALSIWEAIVSNVIRKYHPQRICELGCGYGQNFAYLKKISPEVYGGDYSQNAVAIAKKLGFDVTPFNYYNMEDYRILRTGSLVFTSHSLEQLPSAKSFLEGLYQHRQDVEVVVHFEPGFLSDRPSLIGMLRNRYLEINDYNTDLITLLNAMAEKGDIKILEYKPDIFGFNPLNSTCLVVWKFR